MVISISDATSYCKRKGLVYSNSEIYGGMAGIFDYGPLGVELKNNIKNEWWKAVVHKHENVVGLDGAILASPKVWEASGHVATFKDMITECKNCKTKHRADHIIEDVTKLPTDGMKAEEMNNIIIEKKIKCTACKKGELGEVYPFSLMFSTQVGPSKDVISYLRPETAQQIFVQFKNIVETSRVQLPFGIAQLGKAFRNEISPRNFLFRMREFEQMELEFFAHPNKRDDCDVFDEVKNIKFHVLTAEAQDKKSTEMVLMSVEEMFKHKVVKNKWHAYWVGYFYNWMTHVLGLKKENLRIREHTKDERSHYAAATVDIDYKYEFGFKELAGFADRSNFDLTQHQKYSGKDMSIFDEATKEKVVPHVVVEPSFGIDRLFLTVIIDNYYEDEVEGEKRIALKMCPRLAPFKVAVFPLVKKEMAPKAKELCKELLDHFTVYYDESGSIGRRYRRQDEIGTPYCLTVDDQTLKDDTVTIRYRDTLLQERVKISELTAKLNKLIYS